MATDNGFVLTTLDQLQIWDAKLAARENAR
jgi:hypothetical protein